MTRYLPLGGKGSANVPCVELGVEAATGGIEDERVPTSARSYCEG